MAEAYLVFEISRFSSFYFGVMCLQCAQDVDEMRKSMWNHQEGSQCCQFSKTKGTAVGSRTQRYLTDEEMNAAQLYIVLNCNEVEPYIT